MSLGEQVRSQLVYYPTVTRERFLYQGRVTSLIESGKLFKDTGLPPLDPAHDRVMICGSPAMLADLSALLDARGFQISPSAMSANPATSWIERSFRGPLKERCQWWLAPVVANISCAPTMPLCVVLVSIISKILV